MDERLRLSISTTLGLLGRRRGKLKYLFYTQGADKVVSVDI